MIDRDQPADADIDVDPSDILQKPLTAGMWRATAVGPAMCHF